MYKFHLEKNEYAKCFDEQKNSTQHAPRTTTSTQQLHEQIQFHEERKWMYKFHKGEKSTRNMFHEQNEQTTGSINEQSQFAKSFMNKITFMGRKNQFTILKKRKINIQRFCENKISTQPVPWTKSVSRG